MSPARNGKGSHRKISSDKLSSGRSTSTKTASGKTTSDKTPGDKTSSDTTRDTPPAIARIWRGRTTKAKADEYAEYLYDQGIRPLEDKALAVQLMREDRDDDSEFITISYWESVEAMSRFAGPDPRRIHHLPRDPEFLIELPQSVQVLDITASHNVFGARQTA